MRGYERLWQVEAQIAALEHERRGARNDEHRAAIAQSLARFEAELERMQREGEDVEPVGPSSRGTLAWVGYRGVPPSVSG
jgi:hypothetical protein